jgi:hypothetical protein
MCVRWGAMGEKKGGKQKREGENSSSKSVSKSTAKAHSEIR